MHASSRSFSTRFVLRRSFPAQIDPVPVLMAGGTKTPIKDVELGDWVRESVGHDRSATSSATLDLIRWPLCGLPMGS